MISCILNFDSYYNITHYTFGDVYNWTVSFYFFQFCYRVSHRDIKVAQLTHDQISREILKRFKRYAEILWEKVEEFQSGTNSRKLQLFEKAFRILQHGGRSFFKFTCTVGVGRPWNESNPQNCRPQVSNRSKLWIIIAADPPNHIPINAVQQSTYGFRSR